MTLLWVLAALLLLTLVPALWRILRGPTRTDRLLAVQLFGTTGAAALLLLAPLTNTPALREVALILALLAAVLSAALVQLLKGSTEQGPDDGGSSDA
ncbi:monovalent cation/H+ antiporter complex subunit F [Marinimicrobium sp. ARAG 43.8]|uniref:monovalent cation/H+ antiporter complex subunit F n=1 Tax=Marinimicrobium sp. ARAG 43.8 TaxID=3418719 RepID=UPI003CEA189E